MRYLALKVKAKKKFNVTRDSTHNLPVSTGFLILQTFVIVTPVQNHKGNIVKIWLAVFFILLSTCVFSWNALGHRLVAQIAYDQMTPSAKQVFNNYNQALDKVYKPQTWVDSAVWLDTLRFQDVNWFATMHYIDIPFSDDETPLLPPGEINALWAIEKSRHLLLNQYATDFDKGVALRILMHVVGDIHQPLHAVTRISSEHPKGDRGGNLVLLEDNAIAKNLHSYWDKGAGLFGGRKKYSQVQIKNSAAKIEQRWPCKVLVLDTTPAQWADESHTLAIQKVYKLPIDERYQKSAQKIAEKRIALAGCRLGVLLNNIDDRTQNALASRKKGRVKASRA